MNKLPNLLIIGVFKAGTTSLFHYLNSHPDICGASKKETNFFSPLVFNTAGEVDLIDYHSFFSNCGSQQYIMEATPSYLYGVEKLVPIFKEHFSTDHKLILILRNPIDRIISYFKFLKTRQKLALEEDFDSFLEKCINADQNTPDFKIDTYSNAIKEGYYAKYLKGWLEAYGTENIFICFFDDLTNPQELLYRVSDWLDIDKGFYANFSFTIENKTVMPKFKGLHKILVKFNRANEHFFRKYPRIKRFLRNIYVSVNAKKQDEKISQKAIDRLNEIYLSKNNELRDLLIYNKVELPGWLN